MTTLFFQADADLQSQLDAVLDATWAAFPTLANNQIAVTWVCYPAPFAINTGGALNPLTFWEQRPPGASYRGVELIYPASVVKLFYLVALQEWLERDMVQSGPELERAMTDMIVDSSNDATSYVIDVLTGTTSGPELPTGPFETWQQQRNLVNRYLASLQWPELSTVNVNQKTWCDGPYGRERAFLGPAYDNRNMLTTNAVARLIHSIVGGVSISAERSHAMMRLMRRDLTDAALRDDPENPITRFLGAALPTSTAQWSKAGWTSRVHHDAAYIECDGKVPYLLVIFTEGQSAEDNRRILPFMSAEILKVVPSLG
ncbi:MAG: serine hydrolase [Cyanobacteria bacterium J06632_22]